MKPEKQLHLFRPDDVPPPPPDPGQLGALTAAVIGDGRLELGAKMLILSLAYLTGLLPARQVGWAAIEHHTGAVRSALYWAEAQDAKRRRCSPLQQAITSGYLVWEKGTSRGHLPRFTVSIPPIKLLGDA